MIISTPKQLGRFLSEERTRRNVSRTALARRSGLSLSHIKDIETGESIPTVTSVIRMANAMDLVIHVELKEMESDY